MDLSLSFNVSFSVVKSCQTVTHALLDVRLCMVFPIEDAMIDVRR